MQLIVSKSYRHTAVRLADIIEEAVVNNPRLVMGLATGRANALAYRELVRRYHQNLKISFRLACSFNTDEFLGLGPSDPHSTRYFMNTNLFDHIDIPAENTHVPRGDTRNVRLECRAFDYLIQARGGLDLMVLGLGYNGHIGFNEPGSTIKSRTRHVDFTESTLAALSDGERFASVGETPTSALTIGLSSILDAKHILLIATGIGKVDAVHQMIEGRAGSSFPASLLLAHPNLTVIIDRFAADGLKEYPPNTSVED